MNYLNYMCNMTGYQPFTTTYEDFTISEEFGAAAIETLYTQLFEKYKTDYKRLTELVMMLNWKSWEHNSLGNYEISELYADLFYKARDYGYDHLKDDELSYFWRTLD